MFYVENALTQLELGKNQIERLVSEGGGHVGLAYMTSVGTNFVPGLIAGFLDDPQNKNITFSCYEGNTKTLLYNLKREKYDLLHGGGGERCGIYSCFRAEPCGYFAGGASLGG